MTSWSAPVWPRPQVPPPLDPRLVALADAVDAYLCGHTDRDGMQRAWQVAVGRRSR